MTSSDGRSIPTQNAAEILTDAVAPFGIRRRAKRLFDIVASAATLIVLSPMILVFSVALKIESAEPIFFREVRYAYGNRVIRVFKFRSITLPGDKQRRFRVTPLGRVLRRSGIEALPQFFNVLQGEMSIVGPPSYPARQALRETLLPLLNLQPGMTGYLQIVESRGKAPTTEQRINDDLYYARNWSLFLDIKIITMTVFSKKLCSADNS